MSRFLSIAASLFSSTLFSVGQEQVVLPPAADAILKNCEREVAAAREKAARQLQLIVVDETKRGKLESALAVKSAAQNLSATDPSGAEQAAPKSGRMVIKANVRNGAELGSFNKNKKITLQYVEGKWAMSNEKDPLKWANPDEVRPGPSSCGIYAIQDGKPKLLATVPANTKKQPFHYRFTEDYPMVILRIQDEVPGDNPGFVVYDVTLTR